MASDVKPPSSTVEPTVSPTLKINQLVVDHGSSAHATDMNGVPDPSRLTVYEHAVEDDWSADPSSISDVEDYDTLRPDPATLMERSTDGTLNLEHRDSAIVMDEEDIPKKNGKIHSDSQRPTVDIAAAQQAARRQSIQVIFEKTNKKGRYILTADDPELRDILKAGLENESRGDASRKPKTRFFREFVFTRQFTTFDRQNPRGADSPFHGFFTLFWIAMGLLLARIAAQNWKMYGSVLGSAEILHMMLEKDVLLLGVTDGVMCASTLFGLLLQKLILKGYFTWDGAGWIIQNIWQTLYLGAFIGWTYYRDWPWTHTVFIVLHCLVFVMKQHSYAFYNGYRE